MTPEELVRKQKLFFRMGCTRGISFRLQALNRLEQGILKYESEFSRALSMDLGKARMESYMCETGLALSELRYMKRHIRAFAKRKAVRTPLAQFPSVSFTMKEPYGTVLILSPWNYPVLLALDPLIGALAAGNCCVVKPSACAPETSRVLSRMLKECFPEEYVAVAEGGRAENQKLLEQHFDYIFFTGGPSVGRLVLEKAAAHLTPVTLELGGKSPCIVERSADLALAARRLVFGKYLNCGQTCVAPDYVLAEEGIREELVRNIKKEIVRQFGEKPLENPDYGRMVNRKHFERVLSLIDREKTVFGGGFDECSLRIEPTVLEGITEEDAVMQEEIFGPVLPVLEVKDMEAAFAFLQGRPSPLALYLFTSSRSVEKRFLQELRFGGGCVNDTMIHLATSEMGFGGIGESGMGAYHGRKSFETFSHEKGVVKKGNWLDLPLRYQPYDAVKEKLVRMFLK